MHGLGDEMVVCQRDMVAQADLAAFSQAFSLGGRGRGSGDMRYVGGEDGGEEVFGRCGGGERA